MKKYEFSQIEKKWPHSAKATRGKQPYDFISIESKWQKKWEKENYGFSEDFSDRPKHYHLVEFPYPSAEGLHIGHCMGYGASDAYCRMKRMQGFNVMFPIGWDAFGLPTENYAIKNNIQPAIATANNVANFKKQMHSLGYSFDWSRELNTTDPAYYKWTQWIFLQFYKHAIIESQGTVPSGGQSPTFELVEVADDDTTTPRLAYQAEMPINWCPSCKIGLANEEVINGKCERCGTETIKKRQKQWLLRITAYANRLIDDLDTVDYLDKIKTQQINWIGKSDGATIKFEIKSSSKVILSGDDESSRNATLDPSVVSLPQDDRITLEVFTTRADTLFGATYMVVAPEHSIINELKASITNYDEVLNYINETKKKSDLERTELQKEKTGVEIKGIKAVNPINHEEIPIFVADYVLISYGTGAVMAVPAHDERDFEFAKKYDVPVKQVIVPNSVIPAKAGIFDKIPDQVGDDNARVDKIFTDDGVLINSDQFDALTSEVAKKKITEKLKEAGSGNFAKNYKLRDWIFSRQHYWGEPIPIVFCNPPAGGCGIVPLDDKDLPLKLPEVENYQPSDTGESPLAKISEWVNIECPKCGGSAKRETDTMPNWAGSSWYFLRYCDPQNDKSLASSDKLKYWMPIDLYNGGMEHTTLHLLYSRFWYKFLYDLGTVTTSEPYAKRIAHGIILGPDGQKMSKSKGNVINPDEIVKKYGADTLRCYMAFIGPYDQESAWNTAGIQGVSRFINRVWNNFEKVNDKNDEKDLLVKLNQTVAGVSSDLETFKLNTVISKLMEFNNIIEKIGHISKESYQTFLKLLYPVAPHIANEIWQMLGNSNAIDNLDWPIADKNYLTDEKIEIVVQINGKVREKLTVPAQISDDEMIEKALSSQIVQKHISGKNITRKIVIPRKLVSIVTD